MNFFHMWCIRLRLDLSRVVFLIHVTKLINRRDWTPPRRNYVVNETDLQKLLAHFCNLQMFIICTPCKRWSTCSPCIDDNIIFIIITPTVIHSIFRFHIKQQKTNEANISFISMLIHIWYGRKYFTGSTLTSRWRLNNNNVTILGFPSSSRDSSWFFH